MSAFAYHMRVIEAVNRAIVAGAPLDIEATAASIARECGMPGASAEIAEALREEVKRREAPSISGQGRIPLAA